MDESYKIDITIKNNLIFSKIMQHGYKSIYEFSKLQKICYSSLCRLVNMTQSPLCEDGNFRPFVYKLCDVLNCMPEELFTSQQIETCLQTNKATKLATEADLNFLLENRKQYNPDDLIENNQKNKLIYEMLETLTPREQKVISMRFGLEENHKTLDQCAEKCNVTRERIRQIEQKALRKLRNPLRSGKVKEAFDIS